MTAQQVVTIKSAERGDRLASLGLVLSQPMEMDNSYFSYIWQDIYDSLKPYTDREEIADIEIHTPGKDKKVIEVTFVFSGTVEDRSSALRAIHDSIASKINSRDNYTVASG